MKWFGKPYPSREDPAPAYQLSEQVPVPVGEFCPYCGLAIEEGANGFLLPFLSEGPRDSYAYHRRCLTQSIIGPGLMEYSDA